MPTLPQILMSEVRVVPDELLLGADFNDPPFSESFGEEVLDLFTNLITTKELMGYFSPHGLNIQYLEQLQMLTIKFKLGGDN